MTLIQTPIIETARLSLRPFRFEDAADVFEYARNPNVLRYTTGRTPTSLAQTQDFVRGLINKPEGAWVWAMRLKDGQNVIGAVEFGVGNGTVGGVDYAMGEPYWGRGLMTEAVQAVLDWGFTANPRLMAVSSAAMRVNRGSTRVMEKCGLVFVEHVREKWEKFDEPVELAVYRLTRERWETINGRP